MVAVLVAAVALTVPAGFVENAKLDARASWVAQKPVAVYCARTDADWAAFLSSVNDTVTDANGVTITVGGTEAYLSARTCYPLLARLRKHPFSLLALGAAVEVVAHESFHMRGVVDEGQAECDAYSIVNDYLVAQWGFKRGSVAYMTAFNGARNTHRSLPPAYRAVC